MAQLASRMLTVRCSCEPHCMLRLAAPSSSSEADDSGGGAVCGSCLMLHVAGMWLAHARATRMEGCKLSWVPMTIMPACSTNHMHSCCLICVAGA